jgi:hypothetical protein
MAVWVARNMVSNCNGQGARGSGRAAIRSRIAPPGCGRGGRWASPPLLIVRLGRRASRDRCARFAPLTPAARAWFGGYGGDARGALLNGGGLLGNMDPNRTDDGARGSGRAATRSHIAPAAEAGWRRRRCVLFGSLVARQGVASLACGGLDSLLASLVWRLWRRRRGVRMFGGVWSPRNMDPNRNRQGVRGSGRAATRSHIAPTTNAERNSRRSYPRCPN